MVFATLSVNQVNCSTGKENTVDLWQKLHELLLRNIVWNGNSFGTSPFYE
jgi:hypothetical protein